MKRTTRAPHPLAHVRARHPPLWQALTLDARTTAAYRGERFEFRSRLDALCQILRLMVVTDAFLAQACYRLKARLQALGVPGLPRLAHRAAMALGQVAIGDPVIIEPGLYLLHGQVVIDGLTEVGANVLIAPFVTVGLRDDSLHGPVIESGVSIGTGAKVLGRVRIGRRASIGANAVVITDIPAGATAVGIPATVRHQPDAR
ncbi:MAG: serine O-acetyltransferase [Microthrixaceae bacterium]